MTEELTEKTIGKAIDKAAEFLDKIVGPALSDIGGILSDEIRFFRLKNQIRIVQKAENYFKSKGIEPSSVPLKILAPLLEKGSLEEDETIQDKWAALLIFAASPETSNVFSSIFIELLNQLTPLEVKILEEIYNKYVNRYKGDDFMTGIQSMSQYIEIDSELKSELENLQNRIQSDIVLLNLQRLNIVEYVSSFTGMDGIKSGFSVQGEYGKEIKGFFFTTLGVAFIRACRGEYNEYSSDNIRIMKMDSSYVLKYQKKKPS